MVLCHICSRIGFDNLPAFPDNLGSPIPLAEGLVLFALQYGEEDSVAQLEDPDNERYLKGIKRPTGFQHHSDVYLLEQSAQSCALCHAIFTAAENFIWKVHNAKRTCEHFLRKKKPKSYSFKLTKRTNDQEGFVVWVGGIRSYMWPVAIFGFSLKDDDDSLAQVFRGRAVNADPFSVDIRKRIYNWVQNCNENHAECIAGKISVRLPTRVLDIGTSEDCKIKLWETQGAHGVYTTLSYVWGLVPQPETNKSNYDSRKAGFDKNALSKTMQDAVDVTRALGIRYLWIDALCIIQHDEEDFQREAANMGAIYANSYITISAASGTDNTQGCFIPRPTTVYTTFDYTTQDGVSGKLGVYPIAIERATDLLNYVRMEKEPITKRGWTFQERVLTCRSLFFASDQIYFECNREFKAEDGTLINGRLLTTDKNSRSMSEDHTEDAYKNDGEILPSENLDIEKLSTQSRKFNASSLQLQGKTRKIKELWDDLRYSYGSRLLTYPTDKFVALSGIAHAFESSFNDKYIAGLWQSTLLRDLVWDSPKAPTRTWPVEKEPYLAPSWSWAAVDGAVPQDQDYDEGSLKQIAKVISTSVTLAPPGLNPYGAVIYGEIKLQAPLIPVQHKYTGQSKTNFICVTVRRKKGTFNTDIDYIIDVKVLKSLLLYGLILWSEDRTSYLSLLVTPDVKKDQGYYSRLGVISMDKESLGKEAPKSVDTHSIITLV